MTIRKYWMNIFSFFTSLRRSGTTTLIKNIAAENDVWVLVPNEEMRKEFGDKGITLQELDRMESVKPKPILLDNYTMLKLSELSINEFLKLELSIKKRNRLIRTIRDEIKLFERENQEFQMEKP